MRLPVFFCVVLLGGVAPAHAVPLAPPRPMTLSMIEPVAARSAMRLRAPVSKGAVRAKVSGTTRVTSVSIIIIRKERKPRKKAYAIPDIPKQK